MMPRGSLWEVKHVDHLQQILQDDLSTIEMAARMSKHFGFRITASNVGSLLSRMRKPSDPFFRNIPYRKRGVRRG
jgi:hypothetical protein